MSEMKSEQPNVNTATELPVCFVLMPISDPDGYEKGHFKRVYEDIFKPACEKAGYKAVRADEVRAANLIHLDVLQKLIESPMALCDLSGRNPNALFELGLRQAFDKPVVLVREVGTADIFDIAPLRYVEYRQQLQYRDVLEDQENISLAIKATQDDFQKGQGVNSIVRLLSLTHPAALANFAEGDKEEALLQVVMAELGNLRAEIRNVSARSLSTEHIVPKQFIKKMDNAVKMELDILESDVRQARNIFDTFRRKEAPISNTGLVEEINALLARSHDIRQQVRAIGNDEDMERAFLLSHQLKILRNRLDRYLQTPRDTAGASE